jgi:hypothetical protein
MATTNMKRIVADALANHLAANIVGLAGKVTAVPAGPEENLKCLAAKVIPSTFNFEPSNADDLYWDEDTDDGKVVQDVGSWTGNFVIELYTTSPAERELYEQKILDLFQATEWAPGTLFISTPALTINGYASLHQSEIKFRLDSEDWIDEMAFESRRYAFIDIFVDYPALTARDAHTIEDLQLAFSSDMDLVITTMEDVDDGDQVQVQEDGSTLPVADPDEDP